MLSCKSLVSFVIIFIICSIDFRINHQVIANDVQHIHHHHSPLTITTQELIGNDVFFEILEPEELEYTYRMRPAKNFGTTFNSSFKLEKVALVPTIPSEGCSKLLNGEAIKGNVALIDRGVCSFLSKTINVEKYGAKAAIITESNIKSKEFDYYIEMIDDDTKRETNIPAGFLIGKNGKIIRETLKKLNKKYAIINIPVNLTFTPPQRINHPPWMGW